MMKVYKNVLIGLDGSDQASAAFERAVKVAKAEGATLHIAHVVDTQSLTTIDQYAPYNVSITDAQNYGEKLVDEYIEKAKAAGLENVKKVLESGSPKRDIPGKIAEDHNIDLIVVGATGLNAIERFLIGSVSENIVRRASCDVLIVREQTETE
ncbi:universal stress protein [Pueribacillus sp. YX66]|uniref:universal stress protein n=1 Tax=Pueribacillus sp. YX66 TaxID=3229242 RepID=UPI00358D62C4